MAKKQSRAIASAMAALEKRFKEPMVQKMSDKQMKSKTLSTGRDSLNTLLGGGFAMGKPIEVYGEEATGKTGIALQAAAEVQANDGNVAFIDLEHALNQEYCEKVGIVWGDLYLSQPNCGEQAFEVLKALIQTCDFDLIIFDSVAAAIPRAELDCESGESKMGLHARLMSQGLKQVLSMMSDTDTTVIFINQLRDTLSQYGSPKKPTGGNSLKFYASQRIEIKNRGMIKEGEQVIGFKQKIRCVKNKIAPPFKEIEENMSYTKGVDEITGLVEALVFEGILDKTGSYFKYNGSNIAQGMAKLRILFESDEGKDLLSELKDLLKEARK